LENSVNLEQLVQCYEAAEQASADSRQEAERDRDYRNGIQWTASEVATLNKRKQPVVTIDRIGPKVDFLLGLEQSQRNDPKAYPRTPKEEDAANAATESLRYVMQANDWNAVRSDAFDCFAVEGACGADVSVSEGPNGYEITVSAIPWDRMFFDPHSRKKDFSDAKYKGQFLWMDLEDAQRKWPDGLDSLSSTLASEASGPGDTFDDVPKFRWADPKRQRVRVVSMWSYEADGKCYYSVFTKGGMLERMESPYRDHMDKPVDGFVFGSCFIDRDGNRFGVVRRWISLQDEINKRRSKALHLLNVRQVKAEKGAVPDVNKARAELARPDGFIEVTPGMLFEPLATNDMAAAQLQLLQEAKQEIDAVGVNAALSGNEGRVMSGRALMARSEQGLNELGPAFDAFKRWQLQVYRRVWMCVRQFWTAEKWIRVTDDEANTKFVGLNQPLTLGEQLLEEAEAQGVEVTDEMRQQAKMDPRMQQVVGIRNNVAEMDVDIILDANPATASLQIEQFEILAGMAGKGVPIPPKALIEASQLRNKQKIIEAMEGGEKQDIPPQVQQAMQAASQEIQALRQALQEAQSGIAVEQARGQNAQALEAIKAQTAQALQAMKDDAAYNREELKAMKEMLIQQMQPPPQLAQSVSEDIAQQ
jgi:hypothetical protein